MKKGVSPGHEIAGQYSIPDTTVDDGCERLCFPGCRITIVDDDPAICELLKIQLAAWGFIPSVLPEPFFLSELLKVGVSTDIFLLDIRLPTEMTLDWIPSIMDSFPESKVIIMTGYDDTDSYVLAFRKGAIDFLQKPISSELMKYSMLRATQILKKDRQLKQTIDSLQHNHVLLEKQKQKFEFLNARLLETNRAFSTLAQNMDFERAEILNRITQKIGSSVIPALKKIQSDAHLARYSIELDAIISMLMDINFDACPPDRFTAGLSTSELRVASLIKKGLTTDMIAEQLFISVDTVKTHRKNIRKKLDITNSQNSLREFLNSR